MPKIIYVSGPYRAETENQVFENIMRARAAAQKLWDLGWVVICPHMNTAFMGDGSADNKYIDGDLEIVKRCDALFLLMGSSYSQGSRKEWKMADSSNLEIYYEEGGYPTP